MRRGRIFRPTKTVAWVAAWVLAAGAWAGQAGAAGAVVLDDGSNPNAWQARPAEGVAMALAPAAGVSGKGLRLDYDFRGRAGWASARRAVQLELPENWEVGFYWRGTAARQTLEVKFLDPSGENVWWSVRRDVQPPPRWERVVVRKRQVSFAWGPAGGGEITQLGFLELTVTASAGGTGSVWFDQITLTPLPPPRPYQGTPTLTASRAADAAAFALDGDLATAWRARAGRDGKVWLAVDFGERREIGGAVVHWGEGKAPDAFRLETSPDGHRWTTAWEVPATHGGPSFIPLPEADPRWLRLVLHAAGKREVAVRELAIQPPEFAATPNAFLGEVARQLRRGLFPRGLRGEMSSWTVVGASPGGAWRGLLGADGAFEAVPGAYSLEPFVAVDGRLVGWAEVVITQSLPRGMPIPSVRWSGPRFTLDITVLVSEGEPIRGSVVRYRLARQEGQGPLGLVVAVRPWQVNPPSQFLNAPGGAAAPQQVRLTRRSAVLEPAGIEFVPYPLPTACATAPFDHGDIVPWVAEGRWPQHRAAPPYNSAAWRWDFSLAAGEAAEVFVVVPQQPEPSRAPRRGRLGSQVGKLAGVVWETTEARWRQRLAALNVAVPAQAQDLLDTARANLAFMLINRDGPALQPGARAYRRSWIRDGAMMAAALLRLGFFQELEEYAHWFGRFQYPSGRIPCCVDHRGADPVPEYDSDGQFIFLVAETVRLSGQRRLAVELWPQVRAAAGHIDHLRAQRRTPLFAQGEAARFFGLLPESISHEGYSAKPMHSFWDNFWALRGLADAAWLAELLGEEQEREALEASRDEFARDVRASLVATMSHHRIDYLPGCAELGDFDATSTTAVLAPAPVTRWLPEEALVATFREYWRRFEARRRGEAPWREFTPYELRLVSAFLRLGWREEAWQLLQWFLGHRQPPSWHQWPEIVWRDPLTAQFLGDLPHTWVGSDFLRAFLDLFAFERDADGALVLAAGVPPGWLESGEPIGVRGLRTRWGPLTYTVLGAGGGVQVRIEPLAALPPGGVAVALPGVPPGWPGLANGRPVQATAQGEFVIHELPNELEVRPPAVARAGDGGNGGS